MIDREKFFWLATLLIFSSLLSLPAFSTDITIYGHDILFHAVRIEGMAESMSGGQFPVRIVGKSFAGYGEASCIFYPDLFFYIPALLRMAGVSLAVAFNSLCLLINFATIFLTYWSFKKLLNSTQTAAVVSMIYGGFMYRLIDLYVRSALGEVLAMAFMPLALISLWLMLNRSEKYWWAVVVGFTGVLQAHILSSLMLIGLSIVIVLLSVRQLCRREILVAMAKAAGFTTLLNLWFYVPFVSLYGQLDFHMKHMVNSSEALASESFNWELFGDIQLFIGWSSVLILIVFLIKSLQARKSIGLTWWLALAFGALTLVMSTETFPWDSFKLLPVIGNKIGVVQFPFRFIMLGSLALSYCVGVALVSIVDGLKHSRWITLLCCVMFATYTFISLAPNDDLPEELEHWRVNCDDYDFKLCLFENDVFGYIDYVHNDFTYDEIVEDFLIEDLFENLRKPPLLLADDISPHEVVSDYRKRGMTIEFTARTDEPTTIRLPLFYYPGYAATTADGQALRIGSIGKHRLTVEVPSGETHIKVEYVGQRAWNVALIASLVGLIGFVIQMRRERLC